MTTFSAIPAVTDQIVQLMQDSEGFADAEIIDGLGYEGEPFVVVAIGDTANWTREAVGMPARHINETFALNFWIRVRTPGLEQKDGRDTAFDLLASMDALFADQTSVARLIPQVLTIKLEPTDFLERPTKEGQEAYIRGVIACVTRIIPKD